MTANEVIGNLENKAFPSSISSSKKVTAAAEQRTIECIVDSLTVRLAEVKETINNNGKEIHVRKYYRQARELIYRIPVWKPSPAFIIYIPDLTPQLKAQIEQLITSPDNLRYVLTQAVGRIFENLDFEYYHLSIARNLHVRFEK